MPLQWRLLFSWKTQDLSYPQSSLEVKLTLQPRKKAEGQGCLSVGSRWKSLKARVAVSLCSSRCASADVGNWQLLEQQSYICMHVTPLHWQFNLINGSKRLKCYLHKIHFALKIILCTRDTCALEILLVRLFFLGKNIQIKVKIQTYSVCIYISISIYLYLLPHLPPI